MKIPFFLRILSFSSCLVGGGGMRYRPPILGAHTVPGSMYSQSDGDKSVLTYCEKLPMDYKD